MRSSLANLVKTKLNQNSGNLFRFEDRNSIHLGHHEGLSTNEFCFQLRATILKEHFDDLS